MHEPTLGIAALLPAAAADCLVNAARRASGLPEASIARKRAIEEAITCVRSQWPEFFRQNGEGWRVWVQDRRGLAGGEVH